jgi:hypothetical protein
LSGTELDDFVHRLVAEDIARFHQGMTRPNMQIRAADRAGDDLDDDVAAILDLASGTVSHPPSFVPFQLSALIRNLRTHGGGTHAGAKSIS